MSIATDEQVDLDIDLEASVPCRETGCPLDAERVLVLIPCRHSVTYCLPHAVRVALLFDQALRRPPFYHGNCGAEILSYRLRPL